MAALNADARVMEFFSETVDRTASDAFGRRVQNQLAVRGFGLWAVEVTELAPFVGYVGLTEPSFEAPFTPCVEIGWRLAYEFWGHGYATEAATAALQFGFKTLGLPEIVSFTSEQNWRSRRVMERIGMQHDPRDYFDHPRIPEGHPLRRHVLYRRRQQRESGE